ncbi:MAG: hypothetical protein M3340_01550 [Actinomycetota bacterium]|nr:hypothetical protein [Actinomycetota bacterium]
MARNAVLAGSLAFIGFLAFLTVRAAVTDGISGLLIVSILILAVLGFGVLGALTTPPDE